MDMRAYSLTHACDFFARAHHADLSEQDINSICGLPDMSQILAFELCGVCGACDAKGDRSRQCHACWQLAAKLGPGKACQLFSLVVSGTMSELRILVLSGSYGGESTKAGAFGF